MGTEDLPNLARRLESHEPASLLAMGPQALALVADHQSAHPDCQITYLDPDGTLDGEKLLKELAGHGRFDFAVLRGVLERMDAETGAHLLARLRDVHAKRICLALSSDHGEHQWQPAELIAMGFTHWSTETINAAPLELYGFDLGTYKPAPDWLNPRHWAHPEHWDKNRW